MIIKAYFSQVLQFVLVIWNIFPKLSPVTHIICFSAVYLSNMWIKMSLSKDNISRCIYAITNIKDKPDHQLCGPMTR